MPDTPNTPDLSTFYLVQLVAGSTYAHTPANSCDRPGPLVFGNPVQAANIARRLRSAYIQPVTLPRLAEHGHTTGQDVYLRVGKRTIMLWKGNRSVTPPRKVHLIP